jgi:hypothetical protein
MREVGYRGLEKGLGDRRQGVGYRRENILYFMLTRMPFIYVLLNFSETQMWKGKLLNGDAL